MNKLRVFAKVKLPQRQFDVLMKTCLVFLVLALLCFESLADSLQLPAAELHVRRLTVRDGLPSAYINRILQRQDGFIWLGSKGGLSRFDGKNFSNYQIASDSGLLSNDVLSLLEDQQQRLWVATARGLFLFDDNSQQFQHIALGEQAPTVLSLFQDSNQQIWAGTDQGLFKLAPDGAAAIQFMPQLEIKVMLNSDNQLWLGTKQGLFSLDQQSGTASQILLTGAAGIDVRQSRIFDAIVSDGKFYLATDRDGLLLFNPETKQVEKQWLKTEQLSSDSIWSIIRHDSKLWLGYFYDGISSLSIDDSAMMHYRHNPQIQYSLPHDNISQLYIDQQQQLWIATTNGLAVTNLADQAIRHLGEYQQISNKHIWSLALSGSDLWFGSENGLNRYDLQQHQLKVYQSGEGRDQLPRSVIWSLLPLGDELLLATNDGLLAFSPATATVRAWPAPPWQQAGRATEVYSLRQHQQLLLLGYYGGYFAVYDLSSQQYVLHHQLANTNYITDALALPQGYLLATDNGLFQLRDGQLQALAELLPELAQQRLHITSLLRVGGQIWASTQDHGLLILQRDNSQWRLVHQLDIDDGLAENQLRALALASDGQVWLTGMKTLSQIDPVSLQVRRLSRHLHWLDMEFHANASVKQAGNILAFGGNQGLIYFAQDALTPQTTFPTLHLTKAQLMTEAVLVKQNQLTIPPTANYYSFQFAALDFLSPERIQYQYQLQPLLNTWQPMLNNQLSLSRLPYGEYQLKVRATNADGIWDSESTDIALTLVAPWYLTAWAKAVYVVLVLIMLLFTGWSLVSRFGKLKQVANHDALTSLPNRRYFQHELQQRLQQCRLNQQQLALMFFDLNRFKQLNDSCGHEAGDQLLIQVAARLQQAIRNTDFAARLAGDEFVVILSRIQHQQELDTTVARISNNLCQRYQLTAELDVALSCSIGISVFNQHNQVSADRLLQQADEAMYRSKQQQQAWCYYQTPV